MLTILLSGGGMPNDGFMLWLGLVAFLVVAGAGVYICRWIYQKLTHTPWDKNDLTDIKE